MGNDPNRILIVDDEPNMLHMLSAVLEADGFEPVCAQSAREALRLLDAEDFDFVLSDVRMPGMDGIQFLDELRRRNLDAVVILMSAYGNVDLALEAMRKGAYDYISKPFKTDEVSLTLRKAAERERLRKEVVRLKRRLGMVETGPDIIIESDAMRRVMEEIGRIAPVDSSVLVTGDSGTGKELMAHEIHRLSRRSDAAFVTVNCAAIPADLLESELFGHARGAFTGAESVKTGLFEDADGGTLFLDEIGCLTSALQAKLLRALDSGEIRRLGENRKRTISTRIIAATNEDLDTAIETGAFRKDLYYRLNVIRIHVPPLIDRKDDIVPLVEHFVGVFNRKMGAKIGHITREAREALLNYSWPGNVRELQNVVERAVILSSGAAIDLESLPLEVRGGSAATQPIEQDDDDLSLKKAGKSLEKAYIIKALNRTGGNRSRAAVLLEISYPSLLQKIKDYGVS